MIEHGPLLERLLAGEFVCPISDESGYRHLTNEETREEIDTYLRPLNRRLASNEDGSVYFLAWRQLNDNARDQLSRQLGDTLNSLLPLLEWLQLVQEALGRDTLAAPAMCSNPPNSAPSAKTTRACANAWSAWLPTASLAPRVTSSMPR